MRAKSTWDESSPLYLTLCGAEGKDIQAAIEAEIISSNEVGGIATEDLSTCVAVERDSEAVLSLQRKFPGLSIVEHDLDTIVSGPSLTAWPKEHRNNGRSRVINMDLNGSFRARANAAASSFPIARQIEKFAQLHAIDPAIDWSLYLTVNATIDWNQQTWIHVRRILSQNMQRNVDFAAGLSRVCCAEVFEKISSESCPVDELSPQDRQGVLMAFIPKAVCQSLPDGFTMNVLQSIRYGGESGVAPMVSLIIDFKREPRFVGLRDQAYLESVSSILRTPMEIGETGALATLGS